MTLARPALFILACAFAVAHPMAFAACEDPLRDQGRFKASALEILDTKTNLVWFRCPGMRVKSGACDPSTPLPSETWAAAMEVPHDAVKRRSPWRLASAEELDTVAAKGCGYLLNPKAIQVLFDSIWTRTEGPGGKVYRYEADRKRIESPRKAPDGDFAQAIYVRDAP